MTTTLNSMPKTEEVKERASELGGQLNEKAHELGAQVSQRTEAVVSKLPELPELHRPAGWDVNVGAPERLVSVIGGLALAGFGLVRRTPAGMALGLVGGALLVRGLTGHSMVYQRLGIHRENGSFGSLGDLSLDRGDVKDVAKDMMGG